MGEDVPVDEQDLRDVALLVRSHHPLLFVVEQETERVVSLLHQVATSEGDLPFYAWTAHRGLVKSGADGHAVYKTEIPAQALAHLVSANAEAITYLHDFARHLGEAETQSRLFELHAKLSEHRGALVLSGAVQDLPPALAPYFTIVRLREPSLAAYHAYVAAVLSDVRKRQPVAVRLTSADVAEILGHLRGLPFHEVRKIVTQAMVQDGCLSRDDLAFVLEAKKRAVERTGVLEYIPVPAGGAPMVGLRNMTSWLEKRRIAFTDPEQAQQAGLAAPRGLLVIGVQGCGKSLAAKVLSATFRLPLVRLDSARIFRKYVGESEQNMAQALATAASIAPCILWIDEIEKAFGGQGDSDGGTSRRIFGSFLTWMQEKQKPVFVFATANDISQLPQELLRKGRFDEIFFVDLPDAELRSHIFALHIAQRGLSPDAFDCARLAQASEGFSGAEIEQAVLSGLYTAWARSAPLDTAILLSELAATRPLSVTMSEKVAALRAWAAVRATPAD